ncbi:MAG: GIY-YIG nuclease family protein [Aureliella sp.]
MDATEAVLEEERFSDFGQDLLYPFARTGLCQIDAGSSESENKEELRKGVRRYVPKEPGVYGMLDPIARLIYVGKSKCLRNRLLSYFLPNNEEDKAGRIVQSTQSIVWETQPSEFAALLREQNLIRNFQPRFNVQGMPRRQQPVFICLGRQPEQFYTSRSLDKQASLILGPLSGASRAGRAIEVLNRHYLLRDCSSKQPCSFTEQLQLFDIELRPGCIRLEMNTCLGPCIAACSRKSYDDQVAEAKKFMQGKTDEPIVRLEAQMQHAAENFHYERAAVLREDHRALTWLHRRATDLATARRRYTFIYPATPFHTSSRSVWYLIRHGMVEGVIPEPRTDSEHTAARSTIQAWLSSGQCIGSSFASRPETLALVSGWFRKHRSELKKTLNPKRYLTSGYSNAS